MPDDHGAARLGLIGGRVARAIGSEGARVSVRGGSRTAVGVRSAASDDVVIKRKKARRYVYSEPSTTVIRKKKRLAIHEPSSSVAIHKRRAGVAVGGG